MSTPFPTEEAAQTDRYEPTFDLDKAGPQSHWYSGMGFNEDTAYLGPLYRVLEGAGSGAAKGQAVLGGLTNAFGRFYNSVGTPKPVGQEIAPIGTAIEQDARERVRAMTPDPSTTGTAAQVLHGVAEGGYLMTVGSLLGGPAGAAAAVGGAEGRSRYQELREQGVDSTTAAESGTLAGVAAGAGAFIPGAFGSGLLTRIGTGIAANTAFGIADRYADHKILEAGGYTEMAEQEKAWDGTQLAVDAALGATFGVLHHLGHADPEKEDAALTANLAIKDRQSAPGVATDPLSSSAHQAALEKAQTDLMSGKPVDVSDTGVDRGSFLARPERDVTPESRIILKSFKESGLLDEEANLRDLEAQFETRRSGEPTPGREVPPPEKGLPAEFREEPEEGEVRGPTDVAEQAIAERPDLEIVGERGNPVKASDALEGVKDDTDWKSAVKAATDCFSRRGG